MAERYRSLKVSIGAYSCAVSGFDDPHAALLEATALMRTIAADPRNEALLRGEAGTDDGEGDEDEDEDGEPDRAASVTAEAKSAAKTRDDAAALSSVLARLTGQAMPATPRGAETSGEGPPKGEPSTEEPCAETDEDGPPLDGDAGAAEPELAYGPQPEADREPAMGPSGTEGEGRPRDLPADDLGADAIDAGDPHSDDPEGGAPSLRGEPAQDAPEAAVDRLLDVANHQLDEPETTRRRTSVQRMRHAVRARVADRDDANTGAAEDGRRSAFGDDFDRAMGRVGRPPAPATETSPLVLVSSQRIDVPADAEAVRTSLDLVSRGPGPTLRSDPGSSDTSDALGAAMPALWTQEGAESLRERMATAARALSSRRPGAGGSFARPDLMTVLVAGLDSMGPGAAAGREDRLRAFAALLEDGTVYRVSRGLYMAAAESAQAAEASGR